MKPPVVCMPEAGSHFSRAEKMMIRRIASQIRRHADARHRDDRRSPGPMPAAPVDRRERPEQQAEAKAEDAAPAASFSVL